MNENHTGLGDRDELSSFQRECLSMVEETLRCRNLVGDARIVSGVQETYVVLKVSAAKPALEIYIYNDEAGFFQGQRWRVWESPDFSEPENLRTRFLAALTDALDSIVPRSLS